MFSADNGKILLNHGDYDADQIFGLIKVHLSQTMASAASPGDGASGSETASSNDSSAGAFECNICLDTAKDAVVSMCGHLFW